MLRQFLINRIKTIIDGEGRKTCKQTMKWKDVKYDGTHVSELTDEQFKTMLDANLGMLFEVVIKQWSKTY